MFYAIKLTWYKCFLPRRLNWHKGSDLVFLQKVPWEDTGCCWSGHHRVMLWLGKASYFVSWVSTQPRAAVTELLTTHPPKITLLVPNIMAPTPICHLLSFSSHGGTRSGSKDSFASPLPAQPFEDMLGNELCSLVQKWRDTFTAIAEWYFQRGQSSRMGFASLEGFFLPSQIC